MIKDYLINNAQDDILKILKGEKQKVAIYINFVELYDYNATIADKITAKPHYYLPLCDEAAVDAQTELMEMVEDGSVKQRVKVRFVAIPFTMQERPICELVVTSGLVVGSSNPIALKAVHRYECKKCDHISIRKYDWSRKTISEVLKCDACKAVKSLKLLKCENIDVSDVQEITIQDKFEKEKQGAFCGVLTVALLDDLIDVCSPGDDVEITGTVYRMCEFVEGSRGDATIFMLANSVSIRRKIGDVNTSSEKITTIFNNYWTIHKDNPLVGRDNILQALCPKIYGMYLVKLALAVVLAGGVNKTSDSGLRIRGESHMLMVGDPGSGKSQILRAAANLSMKSVVTTGAGTTSAGLTATVVRENDTWQVEGGALVLADGGVCCIDEFNTMSTHDKACVHEAMEQQTISIAKGGLLSTLNSRCTVIAAMNPVGGAIVDGKAVKTRLADSLLSRFDVILYLKDMQNEQWDLLMTEHLARAACQFYEVEKEKKSAFDLLKTDNTWEHETLKQYFAHLRTLRPQWTDEADELIQKIYMCHKSNPKVQGTHANTVRLIDGLVRLAEGHAKLMFQEEVSVMDTVVSAVLIGFFEDDDLKHMWAFPDDPLEVFNKLGQRIVRRIEGEL